jgi:hypothetical protein
MNKAFIFIAILLLSTIVSAQTADEAKLRSMLQEFLVGASTNDSAVHDRFWAEDLIYTRSAGARIDKAELMKGVRSSPKNDAPTSVYSAEDVKINIFGNAAIIAFKLVGTTTKADGSKSVSQFLNTGTFFNRKGIWQAAAWQATAVPEPKNTAATLVDKPKPVMGRTYVRGPRGGCHYVNEAGKKIYVNKDLCS